MKGLGLEVETLEESLHVSSPLGIRLRIDQICRDCELEISGILLMVDLQVMDISKFDVILGMDWLTAHQVVIDCDSRRIIAYTQDGIVLRFRGISMMLYPRPCTTPGGVLMGWLASLTLEDEVRQELDLPQVVCEYEDVFPNELSRLPLHRDVDSVLSYTVVRRLFL